MFKEMRRKDRKLEPSAAEEILQKGEYGILSTIGENGYPYGVPVNYAYFNNTIAFHCAPEGHKLENLEHESKVSFTVVGNTCPLPEKFSTNYESVIVFGRVQEASEDEKENILLEIIKKYSPDFVDSGKDYISKSSKHSKVFKINIEHISGKGRK
ncbi:pyridoxamine 5'-phosphate oxidase family protein [Alloiococcus sp. CFN-8]|uniref:pyridoxamine 5'-phosphate oxidase family protein n=1 Tax=Alloiococcus sp. CFN-8 TaxID=3416081 RepID=UPI003CF1C153